MQAEEHHTCGHMPNTDRGTPYMWTHSKHTTHVNTCLTQTDEHHTCGHMCNADNEHEKLHHGFSHSSISSKCLFFPSPNFKNYKLWIVLKVQGGWGKQTVLSSELIWIGSHSKFSCHRQLTAHLGFWVTTGWESECADWLVYSICKFAILK